MLPFDPYLNWLGIPLHEQPPNFYRLLGVVLFEANPQVIEQAADRQSLLVGAYQGGPQDELCQRLLSEIAMAHFSLLDPQQRAAYDGHLQESLMQRGERVVSAPPPPSTFNGPPQPQFGPPQPQQFGPPPGQFGPPQPQFGPPPGMAAMSPDALMGTGQMPGSPPPMSAPGSMPQPPMMPPGMPQPAMPQQPMMPPPGMPQPMMQGGPPMMPVPAAFRPPMPMPVATAAPFPVASPFGAAATMAAPAAPAAGIGAAAAPPALPPAAPQRPIDELEKLTSEPSRGRRFVKRKPKTDYTKEMVIGGIVAAAGAILAIIYIAFHAQDKTEHGFQGITTDVTSTPEGPGIPKAILERAAQAKKDAEKEKKKAALASGHGAKPGPLRKPSDTAVRPKKGPDDDEFQIKIPPSGLRPIDSPNPNVVPPEPTLPSRQAPRDIDTPQDLGSDRDPVMDTPKPEK